MRLIASLAIAVSAAGLLTGCGDSGTSPDALSGTWGGAHVRLTLTSDGGQLDFDCARGVMSEALVPSLEGRYSVPGYYIPEQGGPVREGAETRRPTIYSGQVSGSTLTLRFVVEGDLIYGPYTLTRDRPAVVRKCL